MLTTGKIHGISLTIAATLAAVAFFQTGQASADPLGFASPFNFGRGETVFAPTMRQLPQETDDGPTSDIPARLHRNIVDYRTSEAPGTIVIDTPNTYLYYVLGGGKAIRYGIGDASAAALPSALHGGWSRQPARRARHVHRRHSLSHPRNECAHHDRQTSVERMHPDAQRRCHRSLCTGERWNEGCCSADAPGSRSERCTSSISPRNAERRRQRCSSTRSLLSQFEADQTEACHEQLIMVSRS
jgi:hypothetical protein